MERTAGLEQGGGWFPNWIRRFVVFAVLWWVLAEGHFDAWWLGLVGVALATWGSMRLLPAGGQGVRIRPLLHFLGFFVWNSLRGGIQVAAMALRRRPDLSPALIDIDLSHLPPGTARVLMLNTLGLMPGTLGVRLEESRLRLHVLDVRLPVVAEARELEAHIAHVFGGRP